MGIFSAKMKTKISQIQWEKGIYCQQNLKQYNYDGLMRRCLLRTTPENN